MNRRQAFLKVCKTHWTLLVFGIIIPVLGLVAILVFASLKLDSIGKDWCIPILVLALVVSILLGVHLERRKIKE
jgi:general stress protein CsbA